MIIALDTETNGTDFSHGAKPFFVTTCNENGELLYWDWDVDPETREPIIPQEDLQHIRQVIDEADEIVGQNIRFDVHALETIGIKDFPWYKVQDTIIAGHLLGSNHKHDLTNMVANYLGRLDIAKFELNLEVAVKKARTWVKHNRPNWAIAEEGRSDMPSAGEQVWRSDYWLPKAVAKERKDPEDHPWWSVLATYSNGDSEATLPLWFVQKRLIHQKKLDKIYKERLKLLPISWSMEHHGISVSRVGLDNLAQEYQKKSEECNKICVDIAATYTVDNPLAGLTLKGKKLNTEPERGPFKLQLPKGGRNKSLDEFLFNVMKLQPVAYTETGAPSLNKEALEEYEAILPVGSPALKFVQTLRAKRSRDTALSYLEGYKRFWIPLGIYNEKRQQLWYRLHPNLNMVGTDTLRWSSSNPNAQNISKKESFNLRRCFGPAPGREWWSLDAQNIELRIPAFEAEEYEMMDIFLNRDKAPYYGSYHLLVFDTLHPELFAKDGVKCKDLYESTYYQWTKNGNFARQYGCQERKGDLTYHVKGAFKRISSRFPKVDKLNRHYINFANKHGYVETIPDKTVDPDRGYPLLCSRSDSGQVLPTVPFCYHVSGTAMQWMNKAMVKVDEKLKEWNAQGFDGRVVLQVHDELVLDFPKSKVHPKEDTGLFRRSNRWRADVIRKLMESCGEGISIPTPVTMEYHEDNWSVGVKV